MSVTGTPTSTSTFAGSPPEVSRLAAFWELTKPRLSLMSVLTATLGYFAAGPSVDWMVFAALVAGTSLAAFGAGALNMWWERQEDANMSRTAERPTVVGTISPSAALSTGLVLSVSGVAILAFWGNTIAAVLTAATVLLYILAYTPLKKVTPLATEVGAIPGALPPLIGWVAAGAGFSGLGWVLFWFLFAWQIPHFMAICWFCRKDYAEAGFRMLSSVDPSGRRVARKAFIWTLGMIGIGFLPLLDPAVGWLFGIATTALAVFILRPAWAFLSEENRDTKARRLFFGTIIYLPAYLLVLVLDRFVF
jgi:protoheme IX farnesyltransferase